MYAPEGERKETVTGEMVCVRRTVDLDALRDDLKVCLSLQSEAALTPGDSHRDGDVVCVLRVDLDTPRKDLQVCNACNTKPPAAPVILQGRYAAVI